MNRSRFPYVLAAIFIVLLLGGCVGLNKGYPDIQEYTFTVPQPDIAAGKNQASVVIKVEPLRASAPFSSKSLTYEYANGKLRTDYYNRFADFPENLLSEQIIQWLERSPRVQTVIRPDMDEPGDYRLWAHLNKIYADLTDPKQAKAVIDLSVKVFKATAGPEPVISQRFLQEIGTDQPTVDNIIKAYNIGLDNILQDLDKALAGLKE